MDHANKEQDWIYCVKECLFIPFSFNCPLWSCFIFLYAEIYKNPIASNPFAENIAASNLL